MATEHSIETLTLNCPSCGGTLHIEHAYTKTVVCSYCDTVSGVRDKTLNPTGKMANLSEAPSIFKVGVRGSLKGSHFEVLGRLRYSYDSGFWDEWYLKFANGKAGWLTEEEGECTLFYKAPILGETDVENVRVARKSLVNGTSVFITEIQSASISGGEGQLNYAIVPGAKVDHIEGTANGELYSVEVWDNELEIHKGHAIDYNDISIEQSSDE